MYFVSFFKDFFRKANVTSIIFILLNIAIISAITMIFVQPFWLALIIGISFYFVSIIVMMSPFGEWVYRLNNDCKTMTRSEYADRIFPIFETVYRKAKMEDPSLPDGIKLYVKEDESIDAFATGRKTICVTTGLLACSDDDIAAVLAHEFGHISHKDSDRNIFVTVGNTYVMIFLGIVEFILNVSQYIADGLAWTMKNLLLGWVIGLFGGWLIWLFMKFQVVLSILLYKGVRFSWSAIGNFLVLKSFRMCEFEADEFAYRLGYGYELCALLDCMEENDTSKRGLKDKLLSTHPPKDDRIAKLQDLGVLYRNEAQCPMTELATA